MKIMFKREGVNTMSKVIAQGIYTLDGNRYIYNVIREEETMATCYEVYDEEGSYIGSAGYMEELDQVIREG